MTDPDAEYVAKLVEAGIIGSPCLEMGTGYGGATCKDIVARIPNVQYFGTDLESGAGVDVAADFEMPTDELVRRFDKVGRFKTILILNVLEHCFDPIRVLDNASQLLAPDGILVVVTPTVWPLHDYPRDCWRINPNFYEEYARRRGYELLRNHFDYVGQGPVSAFVDTSGSYQLPPPDRRPPKQLYSRAVHRLFNTTGRGMRFPSHLAIGAAIRKPASAPSQHHP